MMCAKRIKFNLFDKSHFIAQTYNLKMSDRLKKYLNSSQITFEEINLAENSSKFSIKLNYIHYYRLIKDLRRKFKFSYIPQSILNSFKTPELQYQNDESKLNSIHSSIVSKLSKYQRDGVLHAIERNARIL